MPWSYQQLQPGLKFVVTASNDVHNNLQPAGMYFRYYFIEYRNQNLEDGENVQREDFSQEQSLSWMSHSSYMF